MSIEGTAGKDTLYGTTGDDVINAYAGNDQIHASAGNDLVDGGDNGWADRLLVTVSDLSLFGALPTGSRTYVITSTSITDSSGSLNTSFTGIERVHLDTRGAGDFGDTIDASGYSSTFSAVAPLVMRLGAGDDTVIGSAGADSILAGFGQNSVDAGDGYDTVGVQVEMGTGATVYVTASNGVVQTVEGGLVTNTIVNAEMVWVAASNPTGAVTIDASGLVGFTGFLILGDQNGTDILIGSSGTDIFANVDNNTRGNDVYTGNGGADTYDYTYAVDAMDGDSITDFDWDDVIDLRYNGTDEVALGYERADTFIGTAAFSGTVGEYRYEIVGNQTIVQVDHTGDGIADETLTIANGAFGLAETAPGSNLLQIAGERVLGTAAADTITGSDALDILNGLAGADTMIGLGGNDVYYVDNVGDLVVEATGEGTDSVYSSVSFTLASSVENLTLTDAPAASSSSALAGASKDSATVNSGQAPSAPSAAVNGTGNELANVIQGNSVANTLSGEGGDDTLIGGLGDDLLIGGSGADTLTGGDGKDAFYGSAAELNGDTITDFSHGDRIVISDADLATFNYSLSGSTLTYSGGSLTLANGVTGPFIVAAAPEGGVQLTLVPPTRATLTLTESGQDFVIGGDVLVYGTTSGGEVIAVLSGNVLLDASFNIGGDSVVLPGNAGTYTATLMGSFVTIEGGGITLAIPVGINGLDVQFADSTRTLRFDTTSGQVELGTQQVTATTATVETSGPPLVDPVEVGPDGLGRLVLAETGQDIDIGGNVTIFGTTGAGEVITVLDGTIMLDASFNVGGDTVVLPGAASSYTATLSGSFVTIAGGDISISIPVGVAGLTVEFSDATKALRFDTGSGQVMLGDQAVTAGGGAVTAMAQPGADKEAGTQYGLSLDDLGGMAEARFGAESEWAPKADYSPSMELQQFEFSDSYSFG